MRYVRVSGLVSALALLAHNAPAWSQGSEIEPVTQATERENERRLDAVLVTSRAQELYRVDETFSGRLPTEALNSSQNITVLTKELIEDQGARDAQDLYRNISGVSLFSYAGITARGFRQEETFFDGLRGNPYVGFAVPQLANIERVEFLKGPAGMLYGQTAPGGLFNYITKTPQFDYSANLTGTAGTGERYGASAEITGPLGESFAARGGLFYEDRGVFRENASSRTLIADAGTTWDIGLGKIIAQATRYDQELDSHRLRGVPVDFDGNFIADREWNHNEPDDFQNLTSNVGQVRLELEPSESLTFNAGVRYTDAIERQEYHEPRNGFDSNGDGTLDATTRQFRDQLRDEQSWSFGANLIWSYDIGATSNRLLAGYDYFTTDQLFFDRRVNGTIGSVPGLPTPISFRNPVYGQSDSRTYALPARDIFFADAERQGFYLLNEITLGNLILTGGARLDEFDDSESGDGYDVQVSGDDVTYRIGAVYKIRPDVSLFAQHSTSFEPQSVFDQDPLAGGPFDPTTGESIEGGLRSALMDGRVQANFTAYQIKRTNLLQADPRGDVAGDGVDDVLLFGEVTSEGFEFDLATDLTPDWVLTLAYGYNDTLVTGDNGSGGFANSVGDRFVNAPKHQLGFWTRYQFPETGFAVALGGDYVSERADFGGGRVKPYTVFDGSLIYEKGSWRTLLRIDNLFDETYAVSGFGGAHFPGEPRNVLVELQRKF